MQYKLKCEKRTSKWDSFNHLYEKISLKQSILVGASQAIAAAFPGVSRSGITMTIARALKIDRESAAKFSFLLATPITAAAVIFDMSNFVFNIELVLGILASFIVGVVVIKFLLKIPKSIAIVWKKSYNILQCLKFLFRRSYRWS